MTATIEIVENMTDMMTMTDIRTMVDIAEIEISTALDIETKKMIEIMRRIPEQITAKNQTMETNIFPIDPDMMMMTITAKMQSHTINNLIMPNKNLLMIVDMMSSQLMTTIMKTITIKTRETTNMEVDRLPKIIMMLTHITMMATEVQEIDKEITMEINMTKTEDEGTAIVVEIRNENMADIEIEEEITTVTTYMQIGIPSI
jgi:hypothetical protein